ncbi:MAG: TetR/AcrR family transcriptional regulator [Bacteroidetes bacterium]|nr:TetR/AcrR family transcriptional regulator [Bacteroidota bacterium]MBU1579516.1 TetR/AcrR family transcriptional regulator [Bacteroidota bacterium]
MKEDPHDLIIQVSAQLFGRFGYKKTTMDDIAQALRMGKSSLYYYFKSKEEVFQAVVEMEASQLKAAVLVAINKESDPQEKLRQYVMVRMQKFKETVNLYEAVRSDYLMHLPFIEKVRVKYDLEEVSIIQGILKDGQQKAVFRIDDIQLGAVAIAIAMKGLEIPLLINDLENTYSSGWINCLKFFFMV